MGAVSCGSNDTFDTSDKPTRAARIISPSQGFRIEFPPGSPLEYQRGRPVENSRMVGIRRIFCGCGLRDTGSERRLRLGDASRRETIVSIVGSLTHSSVRSSVLG